MKSLIIIPLIIISSFSKAQDSIVKLFSLPMEADFISTDILGNIYIIKGSELIKLNNKGQLCCSFSNRNYGAITSIDTRDPLRLLLFYKPFGIILYLDNKLAEQSKTELNDLNIYDPLLVCSSEIQGLWVYDNATSRLYRFNSQLQSINSSNDLRHDVSQNINPDLMSESDYWLVMRDKENLMVFDKMGNYYKSIRLNNALGGQLIHDDWLYCSNEKLFRLNLRSGVTTEVTLPFSTLNASIVLAPQRLIRFFDKMLEVYSL